MTAQDKPIPAVGINITTRWAEVLVALVLVVLGLIVVFDSHRVGIEWEADGPKSGYFPTFIGWILAAVGAGTIAQTVYKWKSLAGKVFVRHDELMPVLFVLAPTIVYVGLVAALGIYASSLLYIAAFMRVQGKYGWVKTLSISIAVPVIVFLLFEIWFLVPLPKGPVEHMLGF
jgi:hypothetical protein